MKPQVQTIGIVLARTDFGEADRIITMLTPDQGKLRLIAKGVRRVRSKMAGGIELFSVSQISFIPGRSEIKTLVSSRLEIHYGTIVKNIDRTMLGYDLLKRINRATEDVLDAEYFELLNVALRALNDGVNVKILELWFDARLLTLSGHQPNLITDTKNTKLIAGSTYAFDFDHMAFIQSDTGDYVADHIKFLRLVFKVHNPSQLQQIKDVDEVISPCFLLVSIMRKNHIR